MYDGRGCKKKRKDIIKMPTHLDSVVCFHANRVGYRQAWARPEPAHDESE